MTGKVLKICGAARHRFLAIQEKSQGGGQIGPLPTGRGLTKTVVYQHIQGVLKFMTGCFALTKTNKMGPVQDLFPDIAPMQSDTLSHALRHATHQVVKGLCLAPSPRHFDVLDDYDRRANSLTSAFL